MELGSFAGDVHDNGNDIDNDACRNGCVLAKCGDFVVQPLVEEGDDGNQIETDACLKTCVLAKCGDGIVQVGAEACDDGNMVDDDACSNTCKAGACGDGVTQMNEQCDDANNANDDACLNTCVTATYDDDIVQVGVEECDTGGASQQCNPDCSNSACGDGKLNVAAGEQCDTGGPTATCDGDCTSVVCGDGVLNLLAGEECDDGNINGGDGCSAACKSEIVKVCTAGNDPKSNAGWVVCEANLNSAWISMTGGGGQYHAQKICQNLGYSKIGQMGGTCGKVCGRCVENTSCKTPGVKTFDGGGACGSDELGPILCTTVMWTCLK